MKDNKVEKEVLWSLLIICIVICSVLFGIAWEKYYKIGVNKNDVKETGNKESSKKDYEIITENELESINKNDLFTNNSNETLFLLIEQGNDIENVKSFLSDDYYNDWIIFESIYTKMFDGYDFQTKVSKDEVLNLSKKKYGYDLDLKFRDINEKDSYNKNTIIGFKWDDESQTYSYDPETGAFQHGGYYAGEDRYDFYNFNLFDRNVTKDENNIYTVKVKVLWNNLHYMTEGFEIPTKYYATYEDVKNDKNELITLSEDIEEVPYKEGESEESYVNRINDYILEKVKDKIHTYEYKLVKEDGVIRILSYKKID